MVDYTSLFLVGVLVYLFYTYLTWNVDYWKKLDVPYAKPTLLFGNILDVVLMKKFIGVNFKDLYEQFRGEPFGGIFVLTKPALLVRDPELIKRVLVKDFNVFFDRHFHADVNVDPLAGNFLFGLRGNRWKQMRYVLTPTFTSGKMKRMFHLMNDCGKLLGSIFKESARRWDTIEMREMCARYANDVIVTCAFGIESSSLKDPNEIFRRMGRKILEVGIERGFTGGGTFLFPELIAFLRLKFFQSDVAAFLRSAVSENIEYREKNKFVRQDFLDLLIQLKNRGCVDNDDDDDDDDDMVARKLDGGFEGHKPDQIKFEGDDLVAQAAVFFLAGFETSSSAMSFALYELALNPEIQKRLRAEIVSVLNEHGGKISYKAIRQMKYLDLVICETLRKYPPLAFLDRITNQEYTIPGSNVTLEKGSSAFISVLGIHYDPQYYPDPDRFDPERFTEEKKRTRPNYTFLSFGDGPRNCIGARFGLLQTKVGLIHILLNSAVDVCKETQIPLKMETKSFVLAAEGGMYLRVKSLENENKVM